MINRNKLEHILEYAKQQRHIGQYCKVPPEDMVEIMERLLNAGNSPAQNYASPEQSPIDHGYRPECECSGCKATSRICAELAGNSQVIGIDQASGPDRTVEVRYVAPPGYVMVPKDPTEAMMLHNSGCQHHAWDDPDCAMRQTRRLIWSHMLAAAPQEPKP